MDTHWPHVALQGILSFYLWKFKNIERFEFYITFIQNMYYSPIMCYLDTETNKDGQRNSVEVCVCTHM